MIVLAVFLVFLFTEPAISLSNDHDNNTDTFVHSFCGSIAPIHPSNFIKNRNSTLAELRMQLLNQGKLYATAQDLSAGDTVYAAAQCRNYLSTDKCVACFDAGVSVLVKCDQATNKGNGAYVVFDDCFIRYEDFVDFYNNPSVAQDGTGTPYSECGDQSASQPNTTFEQVVNGLLTDIRDATPKAPNFYVALTREIASDNETVYAIGQCLGSKTACENCMNTAYSKLNECLPNTDGRFFDLGCFARYSKTPFFSDNQTTNVSNVLKGNSRKTIFAGTIAGLALFIFILIMWLAYQRRKKAKDTEQADLKVAVNYTYKDLQLATNNFGEENILGKGGFGEVFKATLDDNSIVAVKKLQAEHIRVKEEFENEVKLISHVHHRNLLRLLGWSSEGSERLLVLEYMSNGSLDRFLWGSKRGTLDWNQRYEIIFGIARGLAHLHNESSHVPIIHRDIKSSNILLTEDFKPKIADFGLARFLPEDKSHVSTQFAGTLGYTAPEYAVQGHLSDKVDTYSFGVVILEIISGRRSTQVKSSASSSDYLLEQAWKSYEKKIPMKFIDNTLDLNQYEKEHVMKTIEIALLCTQSFLKRPTMSEVVLMLQDGQSLGKRELTRPTFVNNLDRRVHIGSLKNSTAMGNVSRTQMN